MRIQALAQGITLTSLMLGGMLISNQWSRVDARPAPGTTGFWCDTATLTTLYQNAEGGTEEWIQWQTQIFENQGYTPAIRCQQATVRIEAYRAAGRLEYIALGESNGLSTICAAEANGECASDGLLFTVSPHQDAVMVVSRLLALLEGVSDAPLILE